MKAIYFLTLFFNQVNAGVVHRAGIVTINLAPSRITVLNVSLNLSSLIKGLPKMDTYHVIDYSSFFNYWFQNIRMV